MKHQSPERDRVAGPVPRATAPETLRLGMPHLNATGVSLNWLLRESCHRHWWAIARDLGCAPGRIADADGARVLASVVAAVLGGRPAAFAEDDIVHLQQVTPPSAANGWRSVTVLDSGRGAFVSAELVTAFIRRGGASNRDLVRASMPGARADGPEARRARLLRAAGRAARAAAEAGARPPHLSLRVCPESHMNGVGLMYFATFTDAFAQSERTLLPPRAATMPLVSREQHWFGNIDAGDILDVDSALGAALGASPRLEVTSAARRRSDGAVIAVCRSAWSAAEDPDAAG